MSEYKWYKTNCHYCGKKIMVKIKSKLINNNPDLLLGNACCKCIPQNSPARNGIDESSFETMDLDGD